MELLTFTEAAAFAGVSSKTIHKHVKQGKLACVETPLGRRIEKELLVPYRNLLGANETRSEPFKDSDREDLGVLGSILEELDQPEWEEALPEDTDRQERGQPVMSVPLQAHLVALELARTQLEKAQLWLDEERQRALMAQQLVLQAERSKVALESQLSQYQRVLSEQAESLAEERALRLTFESRSQVQLSLAESVDGSAEKEEAQARLREENLRNQELWQAEKAQLMSELAHHQQRVNWLEKRVPRWVRGLFGAK